MDDHGTELNADRAIPTSWFSIWGISGMRVGVDVTGHESGGDGVDDWHLLRLV